MFIGSQLGLDMPAWRRTGRSRFELADQQTGREKRGAPVGRHVVRRRHQILRIAAGHPARRTPKRPVSVQVSETVCHNVVRPPRVFDLYRLIVTEVV